jgi:Ca2+-binding EF-hand superfamily protein
MQLSFKKADTNGDGTVNKRELILALRKDPRLCTALGLPSRTKEGESRDKFEAFFQGADLNGDRELSWEEFMAACKKRFKSQVPEEQKEKAEEEQAKIAGNWKLLEAKRGNLEKHKKGAENFKSSGVIKM